MKNKIYIGSIQINNYASFFGENQFNLCDDNGYVYQWTIILGNNNSGKTNFLKAIADLEPYKLKVRDKEQQELEDICTPINIVREKNAIKNKKGTKNGYIGCSLFYIPDSADKTVFEKKLIEFEPKNKNPNRQAWGYSPGSVFQSGNYSFLQDMKIFGYGVSRHYGESTLSQKDEIENSTTLFDSNKPLVNLEEWLLQLDYASKNNDKIAEKRLKKLKELIKSEIFPEINNIRFISAETKNYVEFQTLDGWYKLKDLGYGYQTTLSWLFDLSKKLFERYPDSINPLKEPAIVLIDELDLHLHPHWQRLIIKYLSDIFIQTQFIVTTHSPFIIQSIEKINLFILVKSNKIVKVNRISHKTFKGWSIEEILDELLELGDKTKSDEYLALLKQFDDGLDSNNYNKAFAAYKQLMEILHPTSPERKLLKVQLSQLVSND